MKSQLEFVSQHYGYDMNEKKAATFTFQKSRGDHGELSLLVPGLVLRI
jgi:hypothetical protein